MEKALHLWVEDMNRKLMPIDGNVLRQKALSLYDDFKKESTEEITKQFTTSKGWLHRFRNRHNLENIKITGEAAWCTERRILAHSRIKTKNYLPVFWQHNQKAWVTAVLHTEWFHQCFIPEVNKYLEQEGLSFKVLLIIDNAPSHPTSIAIENEYVVFLPPNTTSLLQPLDQGIIRCVKAKYTRLVFEQIRAAIDAEPNLEIMECWKSFTIADAITFIKADELKPETVNACWKNLWSEVMNDSKGFPAIDGEVKKIIRVARQVGGERFVDMIDGSGRTYRRTLRSVDE
jgi:hypothetical protein